MGLINWLKDKVILRLEHDVAMLNAKLDGVEMQIETLKSKIQSVATMKRKRIKEDEENDDDDSGEDARGTTSGDMEAIRKAFGGDIPIEFARQNYKN